MSMAESLVSSAVDGSVADATASKRAAPEAQAQPTKPVLVLPPSNMDDMAVDNLDSPDPDFELPDQFKHFTLRKQTSYR